MKKKLAILLIAMMTLSLAACGNQDSQTSEQPAAETSESAAPQADSADAEEDLIEEPDDSEIEALDPDNTKDDQSASAGDVDDPGESTALKPSDGSVSEAKELNQVIAQTDDFTFTLNDIDPNGTYGYSWNVTIENTSDRDLYFSLDETSVNGLKLSGAMYESVSAGKTANAEVTWLNEDFTFYGVGAVTGVDFTLNVSDDETYEVIFEDNFSVYPNGEDAYQAYDYDLSTATLLDETDDFALYLLSHDKNGVYGDTLYLYIVNKSDDLLRFNVEHCSMNDYEDDVAGWYLDLPAGNCAISYHWDIVFTEQFITDSGIDTDNAAISFELSVENADYETIYSNNINAI